MSGERWYRRLLVLYPRSFRHDYAGELLRAYRDLAAEPRHQGPRGRVQLWLALLADLAVSSVRERLALPELMLDLRAAVRAYIRAPLFAAAAITTVALGIGANTTVFTAVNGILLRPLPLDHADRIVYITRSGDVGVPDGVDWRDRSRALESIGLFLRDWDFTLTGGMEPEQVQGKVVEPEYFEVVSARPLIGRLLTDQDNVPNGPRVAVLGEGFWRRRFGGDPGIIGQVVTLSDHPTVVIGVLPDRFDFLRDRTALYVPVAVETPWALTVRGTNNFDAIGRLRPGVVLAEAQREMRGISEELAALHPQTNRGKIVEPIRLLDFLVGEVRPALVVLLGAVTGVLVLASVNLASLLLARATRREDEFALRGALGAGRVRIARQLVLEGLLLSGAGGVLGLILSVWGTRALVLLAPTGLPRADAITMDGPVVMFGLGLSLLTGVAFGLLPAHHAARHGAGSARVTPGPGRQRTLRALVAVEVALAFVLLVGSGLLARTFHRLWNEPLGFDPEPVLMGNLVLPEARYSDLEPQTRAFAGIVDRLNLLPGVSSAAYVTTLPLSPGRGIGNKILFEGRPDIPEDRPSSARIRPVIGDYFTAMSIPILQGRAITTSDREGTEVVAVINQRMVRAFFEGVDPIGRRIAIRSWGDNGADFWMTIVGVATDVKGTTLDAPDDPAVYMAYAQRRQPWQRFGALVVRADGDPAGLARPVQEAIWEVDPTLVLTQVATGRERHAERAAQQRFNALLVGLFGLAALLLSVQGVAAVAAYGVEARRREIGVRMALGAEGRQIRGLVLRTGLPAVLLGLVAGAGGAAAAGRVLRSVLWGVGPWDPLTWAGAAVVLLGTTVVALLAPAARAARVDPVAILK